MFHKIKSVTPMPNFILSIQFSEGITKAYDIKPLFKKWDAFKIFEKNPDFFFEVKVDSGGYGIVWDDNLDLSCDELYFNGKKVKTSFDGLMSFSDAALIWGLNESTLRKAIIYGKLKNGIDVCKYGKQWVISIESMEREYGKPK